MESAERDCEHMMPPLAAGGGETIPNDSGGRRYGGAPACHLRGVLGELTPDRSESCRNVGVDPSGSVGRRGRGRSGAWSGRMPSCKRVICHQI